ncbi:2-hydroxyacid dehydrogenase [Ilumatobacter nonamiensis]|uniref:2-hydroxyacid dehydrogenase n=1 Tax=Ilumatobacter nonamiensis TaxID=467093 RepID=UPI00058B8AF3|nr:glyoxylate/hydroxypyruvate reductase A [Ilumatobacter nonamiensis]
MTPLVPYVRRPDWSTDDTLVSALAAAMVDFEVVPFDALDASRYDEVSVAVVDGPSADQLAKLPHLELVQSSWAGAEAVMPVVPDGVHVIRLVDPQMAETMSEAVLAWTLYLHREMPRYARQQRAGEWRQHPIVHARDRRVGIAGLGILGTAAARRLLAQGFAVAGWSRSSKQIDGVSCYDGPAGLGAMLERSDIVVNLLPHTEATVGTFDADRFATMPAGSAIINFGRGPTIDDGALLDALDRGHLDHAVLDVFDVEPLPAEHRFWDHESVTVLPHISAPTTVETAAVIAGENIRRFLATGELPTEGLVDRSRGY